MEPLRNRVALEIALAHAGATKCSLGLLVTQGEIRRHNPQLALL